MADDSLQHQQLESINFPVRGMDSILATVSGYHGSQRFNLIKLISCAGASYVGNMNPSVTHLVCWKYEGRKYELAKKHKMLIVNHLWIEECVKKGRRVSERPYTFQSGQEVGPLILDVPLLTSLEKAHSKELKKYSKRPVAVIDIDCEDTSNAAWNSILFDERKEASTSQPANSRRVNEGNPTSLKPQRKSRRLVKKHMSRKDNPRVILSDSSDDERNQHISDNHPSGKTRFSCGQDNGDGRDDVEEIKHVTDENLNASVRGAPSSLPATSEELCEAACLDPVKIDAPNKQPASTELSCVICWTDFSSSRGVLQCGHRFCFECIQKWTDYMASMGKSYTCPLCKASFTTIVQVEEAVSSDQKIYSQSIPDDSSKNLYILPDETYVPYGPSSNEASAQVCCQCFCREPEDLLISCDTCKFRCVHCYCLDPPLFPWVCNPCKNRGIFYNHIR